MMIRFTQDMVHVSDTHKLGHICGLQHYLLAVCPGDWAVEGTQDI